MDDEAIEQGFEDLLADLHEQEVADGRDVPNGGVAKAVAREEHRATRIQKALGDPKRTRSAYLDIASRHVHGDAFRVLFVLANRGDADLANAFPRRASAARMLGLSVAAYARQLRRLTREGWLQTREFYRKESGLQSSSGIVFGIPPGIVGDGPWWGPARWDKRKADVVKKRRKAGLKLRKEGE